MNAKEERELLAAIARIEEHTKAINGAVQEGKAFRLTQPNVCEQHREKIWQALHRNRLALLLVALGGTGGMAGVVAKLLGLW